VNLVARLRQIAMVGGVETFGVVAGGLAGLLIVNVLPKDQYAAYTFLFACLTLLLGVTDLGLAHCCLPVVGQRAREQLWVVGACRQVFRRRWMLLGVGVAIVVPYWFISSRQHGWINAGYLLASVFAMVAVLTSLRDHYLRTVLTILGHVTSLSRIGLLSTVVRIALVCAVLALPLGPWAVAGVVAATAAASVASIALMRRDLEARQIPDHTLDAADARRVDAEVIRIAKPLVLPAIFYQVQGVVTVFLVSLFGNSNMMAEVGAFGRLAMALMIVDRVTGVLLFPAVARAKPGREVRAIMWRAHLVYLGLMALVLLSAYLLPQYWILLLGEKYRSMEPLVWMIFLSSILASAAGYAFSSLTVRGATAGQTYSIAVTLVIQSLYLAVVGISDLRSILGFAIATGVANFIFQYGLLILRWRQWGVESQSRL
jgi:O-antigen/teichoic acid export membrane protein